MQSFFDISLCIIGIYYWSYLMVFLQMELVQLESRLLLRKFRMKTTISEEEKKDKPTQDVTDSQENSDCDNSPINWLDSLPASPRTATNDGSFINTPNKDRLDSQPEQDLFSTPDVPSSASAIAYHKKKSTQSARSNNKQSKKKEKLKQDASTQKAPTSSQKRTRVSGSSLLANSLDAVVNELQEGRL